MSEQGHRLHFDEDGKAICPGSGEHYRLTEGIVVKMNRAV
jgi:UDP-2-acetamido-3-amino-2,3-dideoxy-glucuronate N-acetyltransferase